MVFHHPTPVEAYRSCVYRKAGVDLTIEEFDEISRNTPKIADLQPGGEHTMNHLHEVGGVPVVIRELLDAELLDGVR